MKKMQLLHQEVMISPFTLGAIHRGFHNRLQYRFTKPLYFKNSVCVYKDVMCEWYGDGKNFADLGFTIISKAKKDVNFCYQIKKETLAAGQKLFNVDKLIEQKDLKKLSNGVVADELEKVYHLANDLCDLGVVSAAPDVGFGNFTSVLKGIVKDKIDKLHLKGKANDYFNILTNYGQGSLVAEESWELLQIAQAVSQKARLKKMFIQTVDLTKLQKELVGQQQSLIKRIDAIRKKYHWISFGHLGPEKKLENYLGDIKTILTEGKIKEKLNRAAGNLAILKAKQKKFNQELKLEQQELALFETARVFSFCKAYRYDLMLFTYYILDNFLRDISGRVGFGVNELRYLTLDEIISLLNGQSLVKRKEVKDRQKLCVAYIQDQSIKHLAGVAATAYIKKYIELVKIKKRIKIIHGSSAYLGRITGLVKIVNNVADIVKVEEGDVMVSIQTTPDLVPAMKKAAAFVTDIGGITSHAAIVAREMRKPCIIGTKLASKILKDGDVVEVNANEGDVIILNK